MIAIIIGSPNSPRMECRFQYYVPFANHTQYRARARAREHNNTMENLYSILRILSCP